LFIVKPVGLAIVTAIGLPTISPPPRMSAHLSVIVKTLPLRVSLLIVHEACEELNDDLPPQ
jgi:hypothetical protein